MMTTSRYRKTGFITTIDKEIIIKGVWCVPEKPDDEVIGNLIINPDQGIILELTGYFEQKYDERELVHYPIIKGYSREGGLITLLNNFEIVKKIPFGHGTVFQFYKCDTVLWGLNYDNSETINYQEYKIEFPFFNNIFRDILIKTKLETNSIDYTPFIDFSSEIPSAKITLQLYTSLKDNMQKCELSQKGVLIVKTNQKISLQEFKHDFLYPLQDLFGFISDTYNHIIDLKAVLKNEGKDRPTIVSIYDSYSHKRNSVTQIEPVLLFAEGNSELFSTIVMKWFGLYSEMKTFFNLYTDVIYREGNSPQVQFLLLVQASEYYHSLKRENTLIEESLFHSQLKEVLNSVESKYKVWVNDNLYKSNHKTLKQRLTELFKEFNFVFAEIIFDFTKMIQLIGDTRNYYTHYNKRLKEKAAKGEEVNLLVLILLMLNKAIILKELGLPENEIVNSVKSQSYYRNTKDLLKKVYSA